VRPASGSTRKIISVDFMIRRGSLLALLNAAHGCDSGLVGRLWAGADGENERVIMKLLDRADPDTPEGRVLLYICPECGDIGCGAFSVRVSRDADGYCWTDFAYDNGRDAPKPLSLPKAFSFGAAQYEAALREAATAR
jgi:hypothetical protein